MTGLNTANTVEEAEANLAILQKKMEDISAFNPSDIPKMSDTSDRYETSRPMNHLINSAYNESEERPSELMRGLSEGNELNESQTTGSGNISDESSNVPSKEVDLQGYELPAETGEIRKKFDSLIKHNMDKDYVSELERTAAKQRDIEPQYYQMQQELMELRKEKEEREIDELAAREEAILDEISNARLQAEYARLDGDADRFKKELAKELRYNNMLADHHSKKHMMAFIKSQRGAPEPPLQQYNQAQLSSDIVREAPKSMPIHEGFPKSKPGIKSERQSSASLEQKERGSIKRYVPPEFVAMAEKIKWEENGKQLSVEEMFKRTLPNKGMRR